MAQGMLEKFLGYYKGLDSRPVFATVEEMLQWSKLYELTQQTLQEALQKMGLSAQLISELVTVSSVSVDSIPCLFETICVVHIIVHIYEESLVLKMFFLS